MLEVGLFEIVNLPTLFIGKSKRSKQSKRSKRVCFGKCKNNNHKHHGEVQQGLSIKSLRNIVSMACIEHNVTPEMIAQAAQITTAHNIAGVRAAITKGQKILV